MVAIFSNNPCDDGESSGDSSGDSSIALENITAAENGTLTGQMLGHVHRGICEESTAPGYIVS